MSSTFGADGGRPFSSMAASRWRSVPSRRSTVATMVRTRRAVALGQRAEIALLELLVERPLLPQHAADDVGGDAARGEAGRRLGR